MYTCAIRFQPSNCSIEQYVDEIVIPFMAVLYRNGRVLNTFWNPVLSQGKVTVTCILPEKDSLLGLNQTAHIAGGIEAEVGEVLIDFPEKVIGAWSACECRRPSFYLLFTSFLADHPPVKCGDCGRPVPLYRLPQIGSEQDYDSILSWEREYQACDSLYMHSGAGEPFGLRQISDPESELSQEGRAICKALSDAAGVPFYYYLAGEDVAGRDRCPLCEGMWTANENSICHICHSCRLAAC